MMPEREPDWDTVMEQRAEMERDARACPECHGNGWIEGPGCNCGVGPAGYYGMHERHCGLEPCPRGCSFVPPNMTEAPF
jgi:hypothetical protein